MIMIKMDVFNQTENNIHIGKYCRRPEGKNCIASNNGKSEPNQSPLLSRQTHNLQKRKKIVPHHTW